MSTFTDPFDHYSLNRNTASTSAASGLPLQAARSPTEAARCAKQQHSDGSDKPRAIAIGECPLASLMQQPADSPSP